MTAVATVANGRRRKGLLTTASERAESHVHDFNFSGNVLWARKIREKQLFKEKESWIWPEQKLKVTEARVCWKKQQCIWMGQRGHWEYFSLQHCSNCFELFYTLNISQCQQWTQHMTFSTLQHCTQQGRHCMLQHLQNHKNTPETIRPTECVCWGKRRHCWSNLYMTRKTDAQNQKQKTPQYRKHQPQLFTPNRERKTKKDSYIYSQGKWL